MKKIKYLARRWKEVFLITLLIRIVLFIFAFFINQKPLSDFFELWIHWDGPHYLNIAKNGYQTQGDPAFFIVFYPLYPFFVKVFSLFVFNFSAAAVLVSLFFCFIAAILLYELVLLDEDHQTALLSVWFLNIFPVSYFLQASYTESLFLASSLGAIYFFRKQNILKSAIFGAAATATRVNGLLILPFLLLYLKKPAQLLALILMPIGFLIYMAINFYLYHNPFYFTIPLSEHWYKHLELPWNGLHNLISSLPPISTNDSYIFWSEIVAIIILVFLTILVFIKTNIKYGFYVLANFLLFISTSFILSTPRYILILFPIYIAFAKIKNTIIFLLLSLVSLSMLLFLTFYYTSGRWTY